MYKLKYYSLNKEEKIKLKKDFYKTEFGIKIKQLLTRLLLIGLIGLPFSIYLLLTYKNIWDLIIAISLLIASIIFIISSFTLRIKKLNRYLVTR